MLDAQGVGGSIPPAPIFLLFIMRIKIGEKLIEKEISSNISFIELWKELYPEKPLPVGVKVDGKIRDIRDVVNGEEAEFLFDQDEALEILRHSASHLLAQAVLQLYPGTKIGVGPAIENGFYYDFHREEPFTPEDLEKIEKRMQELSRKDIEIRREIWPREKAINYFKERGQIFKLELIEEKTQGDISVYVQDDFVDLCRGPHVPSTGYIKHFKLLSVSAAYWKGDEKRESMQRIYGTAFFRKEDLENYLNFLEEARKRDHRRLGRELDLFMISEEIGPGLILWKPKGSIIRHIIEDYWKEEHRKRGYELVYTPHIADIGLWATSGHLDFYRENMFPPMVKDNVTYQLKPMNCPFHIVMFKSELRSYKDLPIRWAELGTVYRYERSGVLHGLLRVRGFTQDDAHIFCTPEQMEKEILSTLYFARDILTAFGFTDYDIYLSTRPEKFVGTPEMWDKAEKALKNALDKSGLPYQIDPGEGVFYGPKIDIKIKDVLGRTWQCSTIQVDFNLPERFQIYYVGEDGKHHPPIMIHRALLGSLERFFGVLIEHYAGAFPLWLSPVQVVILPITDRNHEYAKKLEKLLLENEIRVETDARNEKLGFKIREAQLKKIPYMLIIGDKEEKEGKIALRVRGKGDVGKMNIEEFIDMVKEKINKRSQEL